MNASAWRAISAFRWCMPETALTSPTVSPVIWIIRQIYLVTPEKTKMDGNYVGVLNYLVASSPGITC